ncbi:hypothetical protein SS53_24625 [Enterobacter hormaechei subsp. steigerwaltii]|nr:hypothetical protein [Enterobacter hormaechei]KJM84813.1 hypothetical protein SS53_24625 [Enterobacter hormaechei subsp. steigerwaltii]KJN38548.1 hypothetical protein SS40_24435 [Enterobacter hormaechei subsp. steigerwaltii]KJO12404.1 hypothetical protein SR91_21780 [Enterobacter hormaechei subsp. steigerwaltii]KLQ73457.1 hypothetical protein ABF64_16295 [Enterobacter hormaechei subsp. steigerwaltii]MDV7035989.1 hypothetical protein [Enterobacter hormaechei]
MSQLEKLYQAAIENEQKLAELEAQCAALAAENAGLKSAHPQPFGPVMMKALDAYEKHQDEVPETGMLDAFFILRDSILVDTTYTDAFLTEVRAQGVEMFGQWLRDSADIFDNNSRHDWADQNRVSADKAGEFAAQLRKGVQS